MSHLPRGGDHLAASRAQGGEADAHGVMIRNLRSRPHEAEEGDDPTSTNADNGERWLERRERGN